MNDEIRKLDLAVISDVHLATLASKAKPLLKYLKSIHPNMLVLNGDIIDSWRFSRNYVFDHIIHHSPGLAKFGAAAYGYLTGLNKVLNSFLRLFGGHDMLLYKSMTDRILKDKKILTNFELAIANAAVSKEIDLVICGHTHIPVDKTIQTEKGSVRYINCGDWVEHFSAAECLDGDWTLNYFSSNMDDEDDESPADELYIPDKKQLYRSILEEMKVASFF